jgi:tetratricopeptide (TPR) repeat protein
MMKMRKNRVFKCVGICILAVMGLLTACSSLPQKVESTSLSFAGLKMKVARDAQRQQGYERALGFYREAYDLFTRSDDLKGKINAALAVARQYYHLGKQSESKKWLIRAAGLIDTGLPKMRGALAILNVEMAFDKGEYRQVINIVSDVLTFNFEWHMELLCYSMVAKAKLKQDYEFEFQELLKGLKDLRKLFKKGNLVDFEVLSLCYYYSGYIYSLKDNWQTALLNFQQARNIDALLDNTYGIGKALVAMGQCYEKLNQPKYAKGTYQRAIEIFTLLNDKAMIHKIKKKIASI